MLYIIENGTKRWRVSADHLVDVGMTIQEWIAHKAPLYGDNPTVTEDDEADKVQRKQRLDQAITRIKNRFPTWRDSSNEALRDLAAIAIVLRDLHGRLSDLEDQG